MSARPTIHIKQTVFAVALIVALVALQGVAAAAVTVQKVDGNPRCSDVASGLRELKLDPPANRTISDGTIITTTTVNGRYLDWTSDRPVQVVIVKGGPNANVYRYSPAVTGATGLSAPTNPNNGQPYGLSHVQWCYDPAPPPPPPCSPGGSQTKPDGSPCNPAPCTPGGAQTKPDGKPCNPPAPCTPGGAQTKPDGKPCNPPAPCTPGGPQTMPDGKPCNPPGPCEKGGSTTKPDGSPCDPPKPCTPGGPQVMPDGKPCKQDPPKNDPPKNNPPRNEPPSSVAAILPSLSPARRDVLGVRGQIRVASAAAMRKPRSCVTRAYTQVVDGRGIRRITLTVNGKRVGVMRGGSRRFTLRVDPNRFASRVLRVRARVEFARGTGRRAATLSATVLRCAQQATAPQFTG